MRWVQDYLEELEVDQFNYIQSHNTCFGDLTIVEGYYYKSDGTEKRFKIKIEHELEGE